jgi:histidinol dehydrogenase
MNPFPAIIQTAQARILLERNFGENETPAHLLERTKATFGEPLTVEQVVERILKSVRDHGDDALRDWSSRLEGVTLDQIQVSQQELEEATVEPLLQAALELAIARVRAFHQKQPVGGWIEHSLEGALGQMVRPLERVGVYVPGGAAPLISSLIHTAVPALVAGVQEVIVATPPNKAGQIHPAILVTARALGISKIFKLGGAQAIGALAFGTQSVPKVDKIAGPGNAFVVAAKRQVYGQTGIEALPGPTETLVLADHSADARLVAADLLAQAEHLGAQPVLVSSSLDLLERVNLELEGQVNALPEPNRTWAQESLRDRFVRVHCQTLLEGLELSNLYAPEHLCLLIENPWDALGLVQHAGGVFVGEDSMEALGDYLAGPSHVMPTGGTARFSSPVNVRDFQKIISVVGINKSTLERIGPAAARLARAEGLEAHARAIEARLETHLKS